MNIVSSIKGVLFMNIVSNIISDKLREYILNHNITDLDIASKLDEKSALAIHKCRNGMKISSEIAVNFAIAYNVSLDWMMDDESTENFTGNRERKFVYGAENMVVVILKLIKLFPKAQVCRYLSISTASLSKWEDELKTSEYKIQLSTLHTYAKRIHLSLDELFYENYKRKEALFFVKERLAIVNANKSNYKFTINPRRPQYTKPGS